MQTELHNRSRLLVDRSIVEGITPEEQRWLANHMSQCAECTRYAELSQRAVRALDSFAFDLDPAAALRVQQTIHSRAGRLASRGRDLSIGIPVAIVLTITGSLVMWESAAWLARRWSLPSPAWQIGFGILWLLPSVLLDVLLLFRGRVLANHSNVEGESA